jgi:hypothetical protein
MQNNRVAVAQNILFSFHFDGDNEPVELGLQNFIWR